MTQSKPVKPPKRKEAGGNLVPVAKNVPAATFQRLDLV